MSSVEIPHLLKMLSRTSIVSFCVLFAQLFQHPKLLADSKDWLQARYHCDSCALVLFMIANYNAHVECQCMLMCFYFILLKGNSNGQLYHDDFHSFDYQNGDFILREYTLAKGSSLTSRSADGINVIFCNALPVVNTCIS